MGMLEICDFYSCNMALCILKRVCVHAYMHLPALHAIVYRGGAKTVVHKTLVSPQLSKSHQAHACLD